MFEDFEDRLSGPCPKVIVRQRRRCFERQL